MIGIASMRASDWLGPPTPVQQQLGGAGDAGGDHAWGHDPATTPLYGWLKERGFLTRRGAFSTRECPLCERRAGRSSANERLTCSANLRHAAGLKASVGPCRSCVSRTSMPRRAWPTSTQLAPPFELYDALRHFRSVLSIVPLPFV